MMHGGVSDEERQDLRRRFQLPKEDSNALDILLFSEIGCEGLDYQFCNCMINYDLPWNPMRIEQRIGRIDRNGQKNPFVTIFNMITPGTVDYDIYVRCFMRIEIFRQSVGDCEEILGSVARELQDIAANVSLTEEEKQEQIQQMTDNKIRQIKEQALLEEKQHDFFGINLPENAIDQEIRAAANYWLSPESLLNLVKTYLHSRMGDSKDYILGEKALKTLRTSQELRSALLEDYKQFGIRRDASGLPTTMYPLPCSTCASSGWTTFTCPSSSRPGRACTQSTSMSSPWRRTGWS
jgi:superfamily II DNA/RNA helicase